MKKQQQLLRNGYIHWMVVPTLSETCDSDISFLRHGKLPTSLHQQGYKRIWPRVSQLIIRKTPLLGRLNEV